MLLQDWLEKVDDAENSHYAYRVEKGKLSELVRTLKSKVESELIKNADKDQEYEEIAKINIKIMHELQSVIEDWEYSKT